MGCKWVRKGDVLICRLADPIGRACEVPEEQDCSITSVDVTILRVNKTEFDPNYVLNWLNSDRNLKNAADHAGGSTRSRISRTNLGQLEIPKPSLGQQTKIAQILDTLDTQIRQTEALIAKLERIKQGLLTDLLTRGIDQNGQLRPTPDQAPHLYKDSPLGRIPREWEFAELSGIVEPDSPITYGVVQPGPVIEGGVPFVRGGDIHDGRIAVSELRTISRHVSEGYKRTILKGREIVMSLVGYPGEVAVVPPQLEGANLARQAALIRIRATVNAEFVVYYLSSNAGKAQVLASSLGSAQQVVNLKDLRTTVVPIPPVDEQKTIAACIERLAERMETEKSELRKLKSAKTGLMDDLLTGRVRVTPLLKNAEEAHA